MQRKCRDDVNIHFMFVTEDGPCPGMPDAKSRLNEPEFSRLATISPTFFLLKSERLSSESNESQISVGNQDSCRTR